MKPSLFIFFLFLAVPGFAQLPPGTEIYLFDLSAKKSTVKLSHPKNITNRPGYDNQPFFHPDKPLVYFSSANEEGRTDLKEYNYSTSTTRNITSTPEREYSPTLTPDKEFISCIIQRDNGAQDLGKYPVDGGEATVLINNLTVGYHAWIDSQSLLLFVLGDTNSLHHYSLPSVSDKIIAKNIGRSLHKIPKSGAMSFVHKVSADEWVIKKYLPDGGQVPITATLKGREDLAWIPDGKILMSDGTSLFYFWPGNSASWVKVDLPVTFNGTITRLAVHANGSKLALVVSE
jgi:hypothetical protein